MDTDEEEYTYESGDDYAYEDGDEDYGVEDEETDLMQSDSKVGKTGELFSRTKSDRLELIVPEDGKYIITEYSSVVPLLEALVREVSSLLDLDEDSSQILLQSFRWNKERLINQFFATPEKILTDAGLDLYSRDIIPSLRDGQRTPFLTTKAGESKFQCRICCDDCDIMDAFAMGCGHAFCKSCYREYLRNQVGDGPSCILAHCPQHKCKQAITKTIMALFLDAETALRYSIFVTRNFIETSRSMKVSVVGIHIQMIYGELYECNVI